MHRPRRWFDSEAGAALPVPRWHRRGEPAPTPLQEAARSPQQAGGRVGSSPERGVDGVSRLRGDDAEMNVRRRGDRVGAARRDLDDLARRRRRPRTTSAEARSQQPRGRPVLGPIVTGATAAESCLAGGGLALPRGRRLTTGLGADVDAVVLPARVRVGAERRT